MKPDAGTKLSQAMPGPARVLAIAGLIPFVIGAFAVASAPEIKAEAARALLAYGAVSLSFLGGIRWGFAVLEEEQSGWSAYGMSVIPSLAAWLGAAGGGPGGLLILAVALAFWFFLERATPPSVPLPSWYMRLRGGFTGVATLSLAAAAFSW